MAPIPRKIAWTSVERRLIFAGTRAEELGGEAIKKMAAAEMLEAMREAWSFDGDRPGRCRQGCRQGWRVWVDGR